MVASVPAAAATEADIAETPQRIPSFCLRATSCSSWYSSTAPGFSVSNSVSL